jgi:hypothetical protein
VRVERKGKLLICLVVWLVGSFIDLVGGLVVSF